MYRVAFGVGTVFLGQSSSVDPPIHLEFTFSHSQWRLFKVSLIYLNISPDSA
jgi:hypothetical protein